MPNTFTPNLAVYSLYRYTRKYRKYVTMQEYTINQKTEDIMQSIYRQRPDVLCFSCYIWNISIVRELASELHKVSPGMKIWLGDRRYRMMLPGNWNGCHMLRA